jgi:hypothetical protein
MKIKLEIALQLTIKLKLNKMSNLQIHELGSMTYINCENFTADLIIESVSEPFKSAHKLRYSRDKDYLKLGNTLIVNPKDVYQIAIHENFIYIVSNKFNITLYQDGSTLSIIF